LNPNNCFYAASFLTLFENQDGMADSQSDVSFLVKSGRKEAYFFVDEYFLSLDIQSLISVMASVSYSILNESFGGTVVRQI